MNEGEDGERVVTTVDDDAMEFDLPVGDVPSRVDGRDPVRPEARRRSDRVPGRRAGRAEAATRVASVHAGGIDPSPDGAGVVAGMLANLRGTTDEIDGATAAAMIGTAPSTALPGPAGAPLALSGPEGADLPAMDAGDVPWDPVAGTFLDDVADASFDLAPAWLSIHQLPGYAMDSIRGMARAVFRSFPCFVDQERAGRAAGRDGLADVGALCGIPGAAVSSMAEIDEVARWVMDNGVVIDAGRMTIHPIPGYRPRVVLACTEDESFLLVQEDPDAGGPVTGGAYVYRWAGGRAHYARHPEHARAVTAMLAGPPPLVLARPAPPALPGPPVRAPKGSDLSAPRRAGGRRGGRDRGLAHAVRNLGFGMEGGPSGAVLVLERDGATVTARPAGGVGLAKSDTLEVTAVVAGDEVARATCASAEEVEAFVAGIDVPAPPSPI